MCKGTLTSKSKLLVDFQASKWHLQATDLNELRDHLRTMDKLLRKKIRAIAKKMDINPEVVEAWGRHLTHKIEPHPFGNTEDNEEIKIAKLPQGKNCKHSV